LARRVRPGDQEMVGETRKTPQIQDRQIAGLYGRSRVGCQFDNLRRVDGSPPS
jgi:hypothetical protein